MTQKGRIRTWGVLTILGIAAVVWADEKIEMSTYVPAATNQWDRVHANRATIGTPYSITNPAEPAPANGTLLVSGRLGIGTTNPQSTLQVTGGMTVGPDISDPRFQGYEGMIRAVGAVAAFAFSRRDIPTSPFPPDPWTVGDWWQWYAPNAGGARLFAYGPGGGDFLTVTPQGNVGIGTVAPSGKLHLEGTEYLNDLSITEPGRTRNVLIGTEQGGNYAFVQLTRDYTRNDRGWQLLAYDAPGYQFAIAHPGMGEAFRILTNYCVQATTGFSSPGTGTCSDGRFKDHVQPLTDVFGKLAHIRGVRFEWNAQARAAGWQVQGRDIGVIAQEVEKVFPELVREYQAGSKTVDYGRLSAVLLEAVKELKAENSVLREKNQEWEKRIHTLEEGIKSRRGR